MQDPPSAPPLNGLNSLDHISLPAWKTTAATKKQTDSVFPCLSSVCPTVKPTAGFHIFQFDMVLTCCVSKPGTLGPGTSLSSNISVSSSDSTDQQDQGPGGFHTIPLHCNEVYSTCLSVRGEQSRTVFFTLDPRRATARTSSRQTDSSRDRQTAIK